MRKLISLSLLFTLLSISYCYGNSYFSTFPHLPENTPDSIIFQHCVDSIRKYVYVDSRKIKPYQSICQEILANKGDHLSKNLQLKFVIQQIYDQYNHNNMLGAVELIKNNQNIAESSGISKSQKNQFNYLNGYTLLVLGETEDAQTIFYELLDFAQQESDTSSMMQSLSALGKLFADQNDFNKAEKYYLNFHQIIPKDHFTHKVNAAVEMVELYLEHGQIEKAKYHNEKALALADSLNIIDLKIDLLLHKISISLLEKKLLLAIETHRKATIIAEKMNNTFYQQICKKNYAHILEAQDRFAEALVIYENLIQHEEAGENVMTKLIGLYQQAYKAAHKIGDFEKGFKYVIKVNEIKDNLFVEQQQQKSQYLNIKFEAKKKEKENALLTAQILQKKTQNRLLYALIAIFLIGIFFLMVAFFQKRKYNTQLKKEVKKRTEELEKSNILLHDLNEELKEFNNILSHDLKEPLRSIVGFSSLAAKELDENNYQNDRLIEYLNYVKKSGKQLHQLVDDVSSFKALKVQSLGELGYINMNLLLFSISKASKYLSPENNIKVEFNSLPTIYFYKNLLFLVFKHLIENGIKFNKSNCPQIEINYKLENNLHQFLIRDNGIGMAPEFHEKVFGMFKRLNNREIYEGSGLGLNIVKKLLDKVGGKIYILESKENEGSTFSINLPILKAKELVNHELQVSTDHKKMELIQN